MTPEREERQDKTCRDLNEQAIQAVDEHLREEGQKLRRAARKVARKRGRQYEVRKADVETTIKTESIIASGEGFSPRDVTFFLVTFAFGLAIPLIYSDNRKPLIIVVVLLLSAVVISPLIALRRQVRHWWHKRNLGDANPPADLRSESTP